ncbi:MAG TPA: hypothetical protein VJ957_06775 [Longimicrobiales bacterium]|nr:hypothetical protein [Longimicrobiales bacterium]
MFWLTGITMAFLLQPLGSAPGQPPPGAAQQACPYEACALAVSYSPVRLVRGADREPLRRGLWGPDVQILLNAGGQAAEFADRYRHAHTAAGILQVADAAVGAVALFSWDRNSNRANISLVVVGVVLGAVAESLRWKSLTHLNRSVWWYNRPMAERTP